MVMTDEGMDQMDPPSPKLVAALLREARSVSRRADKLGADIAAMQDPTIQELAAQASSSIDQLVHQLMRLDHRRSERVGPPVIELGSRGRRGLGNRPRVHGDRPGLPDPDPDPDDHRRVIPTAAASPARPPVGRASRWKSRPGPRSWWPIAGCRWVR
jgi:hypothetical protein